MTIAQQLEHYRSEEEHFDIPHHIFTLNNGLKVLVIEDHSVPLVTVSVQYNVGSKDEPEGLKGFAHLFEHLMFCGTKNHPGSYLTNILKAGALDVNGYTTRDLTYYYETMPVAALDYALFAESDRMGYFEESIHQDMLDQQIGIVINEKDERENGPYGRLNEYLLKAILPSRHPYEHPIIGYKEDIRSANLEKAKSWFKKYYRPNNAILTLSGDIDLETAKIKVNQFFAQIESGQPPEQKPIYVPYLASEVRGVYYDKIVDPILYFIWQLPAEKHEDTVIMSTMSSLLAGLKTSYLNRILVEEKKLAKYVKFKVDTGKLCSQLYLSIMPNPNVSLSEIEAELEILFARFLEEEITEKLIKNIQSKKRSEFILNTENLSYRSSILINSLSNYGDSHAYKNKLNLINGLDLNTVKSVFRNILNQKYGVFHILAHAPSQHKSSKPEQREIPQIGRDVLIKSPQVSRQELNNGLEVVLVEKAQSASVYLKVDYAFGYLTPKSKEYGWLSLINQLKTQADQGGLDYVQFNQEFEKLGVSYGLASEKQWSQAYLNSTKENFEEILPLFHDFLFKTQFSEKKFEEEKQKKLVELSQPFAASSQFENYIYNTLVYPPEHPLSEPNGHQGTYASIAAMTFQDLINYHQNNHLVKIKRLVLVGADLEDKILPIVNRYLGHLTHFDYNVRVLPAVQPYEKSKIYLIQDDDASQVNITLSTIMPDDFDYRDPAYSVFKESFSHSFNGRVNLNLREDKTWTYGVGGFGESIGNVSNYGLYVSVEQQHTLDTIKEILAEFDKLLISSPLTQEEHQNALQSINLRFISSIKTNANIAQHVLWLARKQYPDHWIEQQQQQYLAQSLPDTLDFIQQYFSNQKWVWVIRGNVVQLQSEIEALSIGEVKILEISREGYD